MASITDSDKNESSYAFANHIIESQSPDKQAGHVPTASASQQRERNSRSLSAAEKRALLVEAYNDLN